MVERIPSPGLSAPLPVRAAQAVERTGDPRLEVFQRTLSTLLGSQLQASVMSRMQDGSFMVRVADMPVRMMLPPGTQPGTQLTMTVLAATPQPTFGLGDATLQGTLVPLSANAASLAASVAAASSRLLQAGGQAQAADLSPAARLLGQVLKNATGAPPLPTLNPATPLVPQGAPDPAQLAVQLRQAVAKSGLFYEAHLAEWAEGKRPLAELMAEPQAQKPAGTPPTDPSLSQLINQQLGTQESGQLVWQGQLGPQQAMRWEIGREEDERAAPGREPDEAGWHSGLRLRFALLGEVEASVSLRGSQLRIELLAKPGAAALLRQGAPRLQDALAAAGSELAALRIAGRGEAT
ncbi:flagellar hook-length control protein FliK [Massilia suwonensis]|uniref:Flagellar hook-length control protein FliK n=1 Tax=Massilia suwonensis TaxID=648895 RepID=A0ABW0MNG5_9BURK